MYLGREGHLWSEWLGLITAARQQAILLDQNLLCHPRVIQLSLRGLWWGGSMPSDHHLASLCCTQYLTTFSRWGKIRGELDLSENDLDDLFLETFMDSS